MQYIPYAAIRMAGYQKSIELNKEDYESWSHLALSPISITLSKSNIKLNHWAQSSRLWVAKHCGAVGASLGGLLKIRNRM